MLKFKNEKDRNHYLKHIRNSPVHKSDKDAGIERAYNEAVSTLRDIQGHMRDSLFGCPIGIELTIEGKTQADGSNIFKGLEDALQGILYKNDKQVREGAFKFKNRDI